MPKTYVYQTETEREFMSSMHWEGKGPSEITRVLDRDTSTISLQLIPNTSPENIAGHLKNGTSGLSTSLRRDTSSSITGIPLIESNSSPNTVALTENGTSTERGEKCEKPRFPICIH
jgi:hypothetical protein